MYNGNDNTVTLRAIGLCEIMHSDCNNKWSVNSKLSVNLAVGGTLELQCIQLEVLVYLENKLNNSLA